jgi:hypothetical protein
MEEDDLKMKRSLSYRIWLLVFTLMLSVLFLQGCKFSLSPEVYVSDLLDLKDGKNNVVSAPSIIKLEITSKEAFEEDKDKITAILRDYFGKVSKVSYKEEDGFNSFYVAEVNISAVKNSSDLGTSLFSINVANDKKRIKVTLNFNRSTFNRLKDRLSREFFQTLDPEDMSLDITLVNDLKNDVTLEVQGVYLDKNPYPFRSNYTLGRREKVNIVFSNVLRDYLIKSGDVEFVYIILK